MTKFDISRSSSRVAITTAVNGEATYPPRASAPYHPTESYPEISGPLGTGHHNAAYAAVRQTLHGLGLDAARYGMPDWNPIGELVPFGAKVVVKPNWVTHRNEGGGSVECLISHASILRAILDYVLLARPGQIVVGDAPLQGCDFNALLAQGGQEVVDYLRAMDAPIVIKDFRRTTLVRTGHSLEVDEDRRAMDDYVLVDLGTRSLIEPIACDARKFRVTMYDPRRMRDHHRPGVHRYLIARDILEADLIVNVPKLKTHKKAGLTASLKNLVGINGNKDFLPHHRKGPRVLGGDNYPRISPLKWMAEQLLDVANMNLHRIALNREINRLVYYLLVADRKLGGTGDVEGGWYGNDTVWRMCLDLNRVLMYCDRNGALQTMPQRAELSIADAIMAGDGDGPLRPSPVAMGTVMGALNPAAADWIAALLMGFDPEKLPIVKHAFDLTDLPLASFCPGDIECNVNSTPTELDHVQTLRTVPVSPAPGWRGHCELATR